MERQLLTIADIARHLDLPESTVRYYRDRFAEFIPSVGEGRGRRYPPEALDVFRTIADAMRSGAPKDEVEAALRARFALTVGPDSSSHRSNAAAAVLRGLLADVVEEAVERRTEALRDELRRLREELAAAREALARQAEQEEAREDRLVARMRELLEERRRRRRWWPWG
ncbi:MerR family transcriptional regulator [Thermaerobacter sp. FW80]|uniref:MerR family transcriptional regulator n=1 Tax=Thermaerobacter sp. FW80 TaxID=2546351 RepID=UPI0026A0A1F4|nr:MerR family transcriptional regulator [Thermaerobacter sp. FW80]